MALEGDGASRQAGRRTFRLRVVHRLPLVHPRLHAPSAHLHPHGEPLVVWLRLTNVLHSVLAPGTTPVTVRVVDLHLVALRRPAWGLEGRTDKYPRVGAGPREHFGAELEVLELAA